MREMDTAAKTSLIELEIKYPIMYKADNSKEIVYSTDS